ncbi:hypothetical protein [Streptomyces globisporus]|uniref:hypothetical protein n=1 Tax=Streptomyces globisporus TaxID=1908 RepID=UPI0037CA73B0
MAAVSLETTELETLVAAALRNPTVGMALLNELRVKNGGEPRRLPANHGPGDLSVVHDSAWRAALTGVQADLAA